MSKDLLEKVTKALHEVDCDDEDHSDCDWQSWGYYAEAAIKTVQNFSQ